MTKHAFSCGAAVFLSLAGNAVIAGEQEAIDGCIDRLREVGGPDAQSGGEVLSSDFSQASTLVMMRDAGGTEWRCVAYSDGAVAELSVTKAADDGGGAMAGAPSEPETTTERVQFASGASGAELGGNLSPGSSRRYLLGARNEQFLDVRVMPHGGMLDYQIFNPDGSFLLDMISSDKPYRGQLWQSGDHVVEVINRGNAPMAYDIIIGIE